MTSPDKPGPFAPPQQPWAGSGRRAYGPYPGLPHPGSLSPPVKVAKPRTIKVLNVLGVFFVSLAVVLDAVGVVGAVKMFGGRHGFVDNRLVVDLEDGTPYLISEKIPYGDKIMYLGECTVVSGPAGARWDLDDRPGLQLGRKSNNPKGNAVVTFKSYKFTTDTAGRYEFECIHHQDTDPGASFSLARDPQFNWLILGFLLALPAFAAALATLISGSVMRSRSRRLAATATSLGPR